MSVKKRQKITMLKILFNIKESISIRGLEVFAYFVNFQLSTGQFLKTRFV